MRKLAVPLRSSNSPASPLRNAMPSLADAVAPPGSSRVVNLGERLNETCASIGASLGYSGRLELLRSDGGDCFVGSETADLLALIVTEAVSNAIRHSHPTGIPGRIILSCHRDSRGVTSIQVTDDGVGLPENFDVASDGNTGLRIMRALSERLGATLKFKSTSLGLMVRLRVPHTPVEGGEVMPAAMNAGTANRLQQDRTHFELLQALPAAVYMTDAAGRITFYNEAAAELWGCRPALGKSEFCGSWKLHWPDGTPMRHDECPMALALKEQRPIKGAEAVAERPDGKRIPFIPYPTPLFDGSGKLTGAVNMLVDISERKHAEQSLSKRADERDALHRLTDQLFRARSPREVYDAALNAIIPGLRCQRAAILLFDDAGAMKFVAWRGLSDGYRKSVEGHSPWTRETPDPAPICIEDVGNADLDRPLKETVEAEGIAALAFIPLVMRGELIGKFMAYYGAPHVFSAVDIDLATTIARQLGFSMERMHAEDARRRAQERLEAELADTRRLQIISAELIREDNVESLYEKILDAAVSIMRSDMGSMQMLYPERGSRGELRLLAFRGFDAEAAKFWEWVRADSGCSCGQALRTGKRAIASDVETCEFMAGTADQEAYLAAGIRASQSTPLISRSGKMLGMISTHWRKPHQPAERELRLLDILARQAADLTERRQAEAVRQQLVAIVESSDDAIVSKDLNGIVTSWNQGAERVFGYTSDEMIGKPITTLIPPDRHDEEPKIIDRIRRGEPIGHYDTTRRRKDGTLVDVSLTVSPVKDAAGRVVGASKIAHDITEHKQAQARQELLTREIHHRTKNLFAVVQAIVSRSFAGKRTAKEAEADVMNRLQSLAQTHELLADQEWQGADLTEIVRSEMKPYADRVVAEGPSLMLSAKAAQNFALALHELGTNAAKYGALSNAAGRVHISWAVSQSNGTGRFSFLWHEQNGPPVTPPTRQGFGSAVLGRVMADYFDLPPRIDFAASGLRYEVNGTLDTLTAEAPQKSGRRSAQARA